MLKSLNVKNYAIIENLNIDFNNGFNVFTGETGAGKSIIVGALTFLLKGRSDTSIIKNGKDKAIIEGVFTVNESMKGKLSQQDIDCDDEIIVKRTISKDNHNSIKINESNVTLNYLTDLFSDYVDIHSQRDNQFLYNNKNQLELLDKYANNNEIIKKYQIEYNKYISLKNEYDNLLNNDYNEQEIEFIKFNLKELTDANISINEENELIEAEKSYKSIEKYAQLLNSIEELYDGDNSLKEKLYRLKESFIIDDELINKYTKNIDNIYYDLEDNINEIKKYLDSKVNNELDINTIEERLFEYSKLKRKYKLETYKLIDYIKELENKVLAFEDRESFLNDKIKALQAQYKICEQLAINITNARKNASKSLIEKVEKQAYDLMLNNFKFDIKFNTTDLYNKGIDTVEYLVSMNKGEELKPLKNIASGGEVSRLMLALKVVFSNLSDTSLLILDEIDTGVSGMVAHSVGKKIAMIGKNTQVLCITHLAPVAACANTHYLIYKEDNEQSTTTNIKVLDENERIEQLAIISNTSNDIKAIEAAKELYISSQSEINEDN